MQFSAYIKDVMVSVRKENIAELRNNINEGWVKDKIRNHCERFSGIFTEKEITEAIMNNDIIASCFAKDPLKQNIAEKECEKWIGSKKLPQSGKNCIRFSTNGAIVSTKTADSSKSADFYVDGVYYTQKYTGNNAGGAQDNQYDDVVTFLKNGSISHKVGAIVDGEYWDEMGHKAQLIEVFKDNQNVIIVSADDLRKE